MSREPERIDLEAFSTLKAQIVAILRHEYFTAIGEPERSPGARWVQQ